MPCNSDLYEIQLGVYATRGDLQNLVEGCTRLLDGRSSPYQLDIAEEERTTEPGGTPLAEFYDELPQQWRDEHSGVDPGQRRIYEIRVGVLTSLQGTETLRQELTRVACPDPEHRSPCQSPGPPAIPRRRMKMRAPIWNSTTGTCVAPLARKEREAEEGQR